MNTRLLFVLIASIVLSACSVPAPKYSPSFDNVSMLKKANSTVKVDDFTGAKAALGSVSIRGTSLTSPYNKDLIHYIQMALQSELEKAGLLSADGKRKLSAVIEENDIDTSNFSTGKGKIKATFKVSSGDKVVYDKSVSSILEWESSFIGAIAIPGAAESYPKLVTGLLQKLYSDPDFIKALSE